VWFRQFSFENNAFMLVETTIFGGRGAVGTKSIKVVDLRRLHMVDSRSDNASAIRCARPDKFLIR
jgi:hypothetical protein